MSTHQRTIEWHDPIIHAVTAHEVSGLEHIQKICRGELPMTPMASHVNLKLLSAEEGRVVGEFQPDASHYNIMGTVHGGMLSTILDTVVGYASYTMLPAGMAQTSIDLNVKFMRPASSTQGRLTCIGEIEKSGRRVNFSQGRIINQEGKIIAHATSSLLLFPRPPLNAT